MSGYAKSSHKHAGGHGKHSSSSGASASTSNHHLEYDPRSFLFVINELRVRSDINWHQGDEFYNLLPPAQPNEYAGEIPGRVMRYHNGQVTEALGYRWYRGGFNEPAWPPGYVQLAVFSCNPLLPIVVFNGDPLSAFSLPRTPLLFFHPPSQPELSQAVHPDSPMEQGPGPCKYVAGANPSWMPSLVPTTYSNPYNTNPSRGLAGELPIVLGLMAFSGPMNPGGEAVTRTFLGEGGHRGRWRDGQWHRTEAPQGYPRSAEETPRGFLVTVLCDPENEDSNEETLMQMEWSGVIVRESRR
ncbi:hypothetical protein TrVFT333_000335 [Trichoderma virens FT-333]|nr:hypothetical protein TrVFT333_000335 [Trichoderma virens FT-333]